MSFWLHFDFDFVVCACACAINTWVRMRETTLSLEPTKVPVQFRRSVHRTGGRTGAEMADKTDVTVSVTVAPEFDNGDNEGNVLR